MDTKAIILIFLLTFALVELPAVSNAEQCDVGQLRSSLRSALYDYLRNPGASALTSGQLKDLLSFYLGIPQGQATADCSIIGTYAGQPIGDIASVAGAIVTPVPTCADGTQYGTCSSSAPLYCYSGNLISRCDACGCPGGFSCIGAAGKCAIVGQGHPAVLATTTTVAANPLPMP